MLDHLIHNSIKYRSFTVLSFLAFFVWGYQQISQMHVDVFPDLTSPTVTLVTEAHGLAPNEIEQGILLPLEATMNGATGVRRVRSHVSVGVAITWIDFEWNVDVYRARQIVAEKLQHVRNIAAKKLNPQLAPITSLMGEIYFLGLSSKTQDPMKIKSLADWEIRRRLLSIPGVAQVVNMGGQTRQLQVLLKPQILKLYKINPLEVYQALKKASENAGAGFLLQGGQEYLIQLIGKKQTLEQLSKVLIQNADNKAVLLEDLATLKFGPAVMRGTASVNAKPSVVIAIQKQPGVNTLQLSQTIEEVITDLERSIGDEFIMHRGLLRQADFINVAVNNVKDALKDGAIFVILIIGLFLLNIRAIFITILTIPISMIVAILLLKFLGITINTMTLGGLAIAIGSLVDDAIIDVENVVRRLRLNSELDDTQRKSYFQVVFEASKEIRSAIFFATLIIVIVIVPLLFLSGVEGRLLIPLGIAYITSLLASLFVALTLTPALCMFLLPQQKYEHERDSLLIRQIKGIYKPILIWAIHRPKQILAGFLALFVIALFATRTIGQSFLPEFQEGALTVSVVTLPGTSLEKSDIFAQKIEEILLSHDEVASTARRTGRAEQDEHAQGINASEIDVKLKGAIENKPAFLAELRSQFSELVGVNVTLGQPISHRIDHMLSGTRANIAIKIFGNELKTLQDLGQQTLSLIEQVPGVVDASIEQKIMSPAVTIRLKEDRLALHQMHTVDAIENLEIMINGHEFSEFIDGNTRIPMIVKTFEKPPQSMHDLETIELINSEGVAVPLSELTQLEWDQVPGGIARENGSRKMVVMCNVAKRDLVSVVNDIRTLLTAKLKLPTGYSIEYGGQFKNATESSKKLSLYTVLTLLFVFAFLVMALNSIGDALLILINLPLALIGGIFGIIVYDNTLSIASIIGLIALFGIATRNGLMLVTHYQNLFEVENVKDRIQLIIRGSLERLSPILMTALASALALIPIALAKGQPGSEIQTPMAYVMLCGLLSSTFLNMIVLPTLYLKFGSVGRHIHKRTKDT